MAQLEQPDPTVIGLIGGTGDLAQRMIIPGCFHLMVAGLLPEQCRIVGMSLEDLDDDGFRDLARKAIDEHGRADLTDERWDRFAPLLSYAQASGAKDYERAFADAERALGGTPRRLFHLAVPPSAAGDVVAAIGEAGLAGRDRTRVIMEKPFGTDYDSARELNQAVHRVLDESQVFRIDHFLGKEGLQNVSALRFGNAFVEPVFDRDHVDSIQIDVPESLTIVGRAGFYEATGCLKDMVTTHLLQVLGFVAMEPPTSFDAERLRDRKVEVFRAMTPIEPAKTVYGQYDGYRDEPGVAADSTTETFVAAQVGIDNWRWADVPIFLRTGKAMATKASLVTVTFKEPPIQPFRWDDDVRDGRNALRFDLGDTPEIALEFLAKRPGPRMVLEESELRFVVGDDQRGALLQPYERLFHDALLGRQTLFTRADGIERVWQIAQPLLDGPPPVQSYAQGSWGPAASDALVGERGWELTTRTGAS